MGNRKELGVGAEIGRNRQKTAIARSWELGVFFARSWEMGSLFARSWARPTWGLSEGRFLMLYACPRSEFFGAQLFSAYFCLFLPISAYFCLKKSNILAIVTKSQLLAIANSNPVIPDPYEFGPQLPAPYGFPSQLPAPCDPLSGAFGGALFDAVYLPA